MGFLSSPTPALDPVGSTEIIGKGDLFLSSLLGFSKEHFALTFHTTPRIGLDDLVGLFQLKIFYNSLTFLSIISDLDLWIYSTLSAAFVVQNIGILRVNAGIICTTTENTGW